MFGAGVEDTGVFGAAVGGASVGVTGAAVGVRVGTVCARLFWPGVAHAPGAARKAISNAAPAAA
jgi:hypothetical protein